MGFVARDEALVRLRSEPVPRIVPLLVERVGVDRRPLRGCLVLRCVAHDVGPPALSRQARALPRVRVLKCVLLTDVERKVY